MKWLSRVRKVWIFAGNKRFRVDLRWNKKISRENFCLPDIFAIRRDVSRASLKLQARKVVFSPADISRVRVITCQFIRLKRWPLSTHHFFSCVRANCRNKMARKLGANIRRWLVRLFTASSEWGFPVSVAQIHGQHKHHFGIVGCT